MNEKEQRGLRMSLELKHPWRGELAFDLLIKGMPLRDVAKIHDTTYTRALYDAKQVCREENRELYDRLYELHGVKKEDELGCYTYLPLKHLRKYGKELLGGIEEPI